MCPSSCPTVTTDSPLRTSPECARARQRIQLTDPDHDLSLLPQEASTRALESPTHSLNHPVDHLPSPRVTINVRQMAPSSHPWSPSPTTRQEICVHHREDSDNPLKVHRLNLLSMVIPQGIQQGVGLQVIARMSRLTLGHPTKTPRASVDSPALKQRAGLFTVIFTESRTTTTTSTRNPLPPDPRPPVAIPTRQTLVKYMSINIPSMAMVMIHTSAVTRSPPPFVLILDSTQSRATNHPLISRLLPPIQRTTLQKATLSRTTPGRRLTKATDLDPLPFPLRTPCWGWGPCYHLTP